MKKLILISRSNLILHAEKFRYTIENLNLLPNEVDEATLLNLKKNGNFDLIFNYFTIAANGNDFHHELIANSFRETIKSVLSEVYPNLTIPELNALSWIGLQYTLEFNSQVASNPIYLQNMDSTLNNIFNNYPNGCN